MSNQINLSENYFSDQIKIKNKSQNFLEKSIEKIFEQNINLGDYYNTMISKSKNFPNDIKTQTTKKKLSEVMFDIPFFIKDTDFFSKYENILNCIIQRDLEIVPSIEIHSSIKDYLFSKHQPKKHATHENENDSKLANLNTNELVVTSDINLNLNLKVSKKKVPKKVNFTKKFQKSSNNY